MSDSPKEVAATNVLRRLVGAHSERISLLAKESASGSDFFEVSARGGDVVVAGSSATALCRGAYHYLKEACHVQVSWSSGTIQLPERFPDFTCQTVTCPNQLRYYLSVCTFGYSTVWWDWARWEREIDWMAIHGINMPLALVGQEFVWQRVFRDLGLTDAEIEGHFTGPAFLPWHRLGNINGHMGPLTQSWIDSQAGLQRKILDRERELGMMPVTPGFSGFVPAAFKRVHPEVELHSAEPWAGFPPTTYVDPRSDLFVEIGSRYVKAYRETFGPVHHYLCETFAEQVPQIEPNGELDYLRALGKATWNSLADADPEAHWVIQGWPFFFAADFWTPERGAALFDSVSSDRLIVLDQITETYEIWRNQPTVREKGWIHSVVHNYGQTTHLHGDLSAFANRAWTAMNDPDRGNLLGMGFVPEGIDQNPVVYELLCDVMWSSDRFDVSNWIGRYLNSRYGAAPSAALTAWEKLLDSTYGVEGAHTLRYCWRFRPIEQPIVQWQNVPLVLAAGDHLMGTASEIGKSRGYQRDLVDVTKTWLGGLADLVLDSALAARRGNTEEYRSHRDLFFQILLDLDRLLATLPEHRLSTWIASARALASDADAADQLEINARIQITSWGGPFLFDYAIKEWAGLIKEFQLERWRIYFDCLDRLDRGEKISMPDFGAWEFQWASTVRPEPKQELEDPVKVAQDLTDRYGKYVAPFVEKSRVETSHDRGLMHATEYDSESPHMSLLLDLKKTELIQGAVIFPLFGQGLKGRYFLSLSSDGETWNPIPGDGASSVRGDRWSFDPMEARFLRFHIEREFGEANHLFQVFTFK